METRKIGTLEVSVVGLGTNNFGTEFFGNACDAKESAEIVHVALDSGVTFFDTAEEYSVKTKFGVGRSEEFLGAALGSRRDEVVIATKFMAESLDELGVRGAERIERSVEGSLRRLGTDYIDLLQQHFADPKFPIEETLTALDRLVQSGKVREIGCCNFTGRLIDDAAAAAAELGGPRYETAQNRYTVLEAATPVGDELQESDGASVDEKNRPRDVLTERPEGFVRACIDHDMGLIPYFPLASGLLTGKYRDGAPEGSRMAFAEGLAKLELTERNLRIARELQDYAEQHDRTLVELAISWLTSQPVVRSVIAGATRPEQVRANAGSGDWAMTEENRAEVEAIVAAA